MNRIKESNEIEVHLQIGESCQAYKIQREKIGCSIPGKLQNLMMQRSERCRNFRELIHRVYEGNDVVFPLAYELFLLFLAISQTVK